LALKDSYRDGILIENAEIAKNIFRIRLSGDFQGAPGQFYMLRGWEGNDPFLPRPISIADLREGVLTMIYEVRGKGTHIISSLKPGDTLSLLGPLGNGFQLEEGKRVAIVAGGIGIAPMLYLAKSLGAKAYLYAGFRSDPYLLEDFEDHTNEIIISTEDGSIGHRGFVTDIFDPEAYDTVYSCGPMPMMEALGRKCLDKTQLYVSLESHMACGIGICLGCTVPTIRGMERVCKEGPVFSAQEVIL
jgi:dihydroorotate dehydrogenase electron transfer subunit